jgi:hypothetical protein
MTIQDKLEEIRERYVYFQDFEEWKSELPPEITLVGRGKPYINCLGWVVGYQPLQRSNAISPSPYTDTICALLSETIVERSNIVQGDIIGYSRVQKSPDTLNIPPVY